MVMRTEGGKKFFDEQLLSHIRNGDKDNVRSILKNVDVKNLVDSAGKSLLHHCIPTRNEYNLIRYFVDRGCKVDALDNSGNTPLMIAVGCKDTEGAYSMIRYNADILLCGQGKQNPLQMFLAPEFQYYDDELSWIFLKALRRKFPADNQQIAKILADAKCPFPRAMYFRDLLITEYILKAGCTVHDRDPGNSCTALHQSVQYTYSLNVKLLLERGADVNAKNADGETPLDYYDPGSKESYEVLVALLHHGISLSDSTIKIYEFAGKVLERGQLNEIQALLAWYDFDFDNNSWNENGQTLLHAIAGNGHRGVTDVLKGRKFDVNKRDNQGRTALSRAVFYSYPSCLEILFKHGADPNVTGRSGSFTAFYQIFNGSVRNGYAEKDELKCIELFLEYGVDVLRENERGGTIFDIPLDNRDFYRIKPVIAQVAMMEAMGRKVKEDELKKLENDKNYKKYFALCRSKIEKLRKTMISETVSLFSFLTESEDKLLRYVRNCEATAKLKQIIFAERRSDIFFVKLLRKRVQGILKIAKLRKQAALSISKIVQLRDNWYLIDEIVQFLDTQSLENVCQAT